MKLTERTMERKAKLALEACLGKVPFLSFKSRMKWMAKGNNFLVKVKTPSGSRDLLVAIKNNGQPRIIRSVAVELARACREKNSTYGLVVAPYISPETAEICVEEGVGYLDLAGNCRMSFKDVYIEQSGKPNPSVLRREQRSLFSEKAIRVLRVLLEQPQKKWLLIELAKAAKVSLGQAFNVKKLLLDKEFIVVNKTGVTLVNPEQLLIEWTGAQVPRKNWFEYFTLKSSAELEADLVKLCSKKNIPYALMGFSAALRYAPAVRSHRAMAYVSGDINKIAQALGLKKVASGANVVLAQPVGDGVFYRSQDIDKMKIVSPLQTYLDLIGFRGRGEEAAHMILERKVRPTW